MIRGVGGNAKLVYTHEPILIAERRLWRGVLQQAYADGELPLGDESEDELFIEQTRARNFLRADTLGEKEGLRLVCDYADVPFDRVVTWARKHYAPPTRQDLKKAEARDAKEVEEIVEAVRERKAITFSLGEFSSPLPLLSHLLQ